jgi:hypothetical protein
LWFFVFVFLSSFFTVCLYFHSLHCVYVYACSTLKMF